MRLAARPTEITRRHCMKSLVAALMASWAHARAKPQCGDWPLWNAFVEQFMQQDGRIIDRDNASKYTTSEGQAYALFFALVAGDKQRFEILLRWTEHNLAGGNFAANLPGWRWGAREDGQWGLIDSNAATDSDLWLAHTLFEAARIWRVERYRTLASALAKQIAAKEIVEIPGIGPTLLSGPNGFRGADGSIRINPSYLALHQLRGMASHDLDGPWSRVAAGMPALLKAVAPLGIVPDWATYTPGAGWRKSATPSVGSYDAIRAYLWAGIAAPDDPLRPQVLAATKGMLKPIFNAGKPPLEVMTDSAEFRGSGPAGFSAALLPWLKALGQADLLAQQNKRWNELGGSRKTGAEAPGRQPPTYYDHALSLFGFGALEGRFRFDARGRLSTACG